MTQDTNELDCFELDEGQEETEKPKEKSDDGLSQIGVQEFEMDMSLAPDFCQ